MVCLCHLVWRLHPCQTAAAFLVRLQPISLDTGASCPFNSILVHQLFKNYIHLQTAQKWLFRWPPYQWPFFHVVFGYFQCVLNACNYYPISVHIRTSVLNKPIFAAVSIVNVCQSSYILTLTVVRTDTITFLLQNVSIVMSTFSQLLLQSNFQLWPPICNIFSRPPYSRSNNFAEPYWFMPDEDRIFLNSARGWRRRLPSLIWELVAVF